MDPKLYKMLLDTFNTELHECHQELVDSLLALEKNTGTETLQDILQTLFRVSHNIKGSSKSVGIDDISTIAHKLEDLFSVWKEENHIPHKSEIDHCLAQCDKMINVLNDFIGSEKNKTTSQTDNTKKVDKMLNESILKIPLSRIEKVNAKANEFITYRLTLTNFLKELNQVIVSMVDNNNELNASQQELLNQLTKLKDSGMQFNNEFSRSINALQIELQTMRLLPIEHILIPLERTVREIANSLEKTVSLEIKGGNIELDKSILDLIKDPLQHIVRNSIGHGIESNEERKQLNKPLPSPIRIVVSHISDKIQIVVSDDGRGLDPEQIKQCAINLKLITPDQAQGFNQEQCLDLIFLPGFSTKSTVTELSGRGVGLDVVHANILKMKGSVKVHSEKGRGTVFTIMLPLTLANTRGLFIQTQQQTFMLPTLTVNTLYNIPTRDLKIINGQSTFQIDNVPIPVILLSHLLKMREVELKSEYQGIMIESHQHQAIILVDSILDEHDCVINPIPNPLNKIPHLIGVTLTGNGELVLVLDIVRLTFSAMQTSLHHLNHLVEKNEEKITVPSSFNILVVDDSITSRTLTIHSLEAAGYHTENTINGQLAWELIQQKPFDCIITDVEMPMMDGIELTQCVKSNQNYQSIPIIIVSSKGSEHDKERGLEVGADAYIVKSQYDSRKLIQIVESLL